MAMRIDGGQPTENKTGFSMEQLKGMTKEQLLTVFDTNNSGTVSDKELNSKGITGEEISELRGYMQEVGIEKEVRATKTGFSVEQLLAMTKEQLVTIFDKNNSGTISGKEIAEKRLTSEDVADVQSRVKSLGIEEAEKAEKSSAVTKNSTVAATNSTAIKKSTQAETPKTAASNDHRPKQVPLGCAPRKVTPPRDIHIPKAAHCWDNQGTYRVGKNKEYYVRNIPRRGEFSYSEYDSNKKLAFRYFGLYGTDYRTKYNADEWYITFEYDKQGRLVREIKYDENGKPTRLDEYRYDSYNQVCYWTTYWESDLDKLKPGQPLPKKEPKFCSVDDANSL